MNHLGNLSRKLHSTFSSFSKESALSGIHPWMASPATALSHGGHPAATCSPSRLFRRLRSRKLRDAAGTATTAFPGSSASSLTFSDLLAADDELRSEDTGTGNGTGAADSCARGWLRSLSPPDESAAGVTETAFLDAMQPMAAAAAHYEHHQAPPTIRRGRARTQTKIGA